MDVILDTNIFIGDFNMESNNFKILFDYLNKTNSNIILPQIVYQELKGVYKRKLSNRYNEYKNSRKRLKKILLSDNKIEMINLDLNNKTKLYIDSLLEKIDVNKDGIVPYKPGYLNKIVKRASERKKPFSKDGEEFRDALLWLTIIDIAKDLKNKELIFISENKKDFALKNNLHPDLANEAKKNNIKINYFNTLKHFVKYHASNISYINLKWIDNKLNEYNINDKVLELLNDEAYSDLIEWLSWNDNKPDGYVNPLYIDLDISDFFVYKMNDESVFIEVELISEIEIEAEVLAEDFGTKNGRRYEYVANPKTRGINSVPVKASNEKILSRYFTPEITVNVEIILNNKKIEDFRIKDWFIY